MLRGLRFLWGVALVWAWFSLISVMFLALAGCDALVADNPACVYDCASSSSYTGGAR